MGAGRPMLAVQARGEAVASAGRILHPQHTPRGGSGLIIPGQAGGKENGHRQQYDGQGHKDPEER